MQYEDLHMNHHIPLGYDWGPSVDAPPDVPILTDLALSDGEMTYPCAGSYRRTKWWHVAHLTNGYGETYVLNRHRYGTELFPYGTLAGVNHLYLDGSVAWRTPDEMTPKHIRGWWKDGPPPYGLP